MERIIFTFDPRDIVFSADWLINFVTSQCLVQSLGKPLDKSHHLRHLLQGIWSLLQFPAMSLYFDFPCDDIGTACHSTGLRIFCSSVRYFCDLSWIYPVFLKLDLSPAYELLLFWSPLTFRSSCTEYWSSPQLPLPAFWILLLAFWILSTLLLNTTSSKS